jgi:DNA-directed RNA polymerase specialized sigma24 family protein
LIDKQRLDVLFRDTTKNRKAIELQLYELTKIVGATVLNKLPGVEQDDIIHDAYAIVIRQVGKFDASKGSSAYSYFYKIAEREVRRYSKRAATKRLQCAETCVLDTRKRAADHAPAVSKVLDDSVPEDQVAVPLKILDRLLRKARNEIRDLTPQDGTYGYLSTGIGWLQQYRRALVGTYYPCDLPSVHYSRDRVTAIRH